MEAQDEMDGIPEQDFQPDAKAPMPVVPEHMANAEQLNQADIDIEPPQQQIMQFSQEEIENLKEIFSLFDKEK